MKVKLLLSLVALFSLGACNAMTDDDRHPDLPELAADTYHLQTVGGQPLPVLIAQRHVEGLTLELDVLDSVQVHVTAGGGWTRDIWMRRITGDSAAVPMHLEDQGTWAFEPSGYIFATNTSTMALLIDRSNAGDFIADLYIPGNPATFRAAINRSPREVIISGVRNR